MNNNYKQDSTFSLKHQNRVAELNTNNQFSSFEGIENKNPFPSTAFNGVISQNIKTNSDNMKSQFFTENKPKHEIDNNIFSTNKNHNTFSSTVPIRFRPILATAKAEANELENQENTCQKGFSSEDILMLVNNSKHVENLLSTENPMTKIDIFQSEISKDIKKLNDIETNQQSLIESKQGLDIKMKDLNDLLFNFQEHFTKFENMTNSYQTQTTTGESTNRFSCPNCEMKIAKNFSSKISNDNYNSNLRETEQISTAFSPRNNTNQSLVQNKHMSQSQMEISFLKKKNEISNSTEGNHNNYQNYLTNSGHLTKNKNTTQSTISMSNNNVNDDLNNKSDLNTQLLAVSDKINNLFYESQFTDAVNLWKQFNYENLGNCSIERTIEMLTVSLKVRDKEIEKLNQLGKINDSLQKEIKNKNQEIVELFADQELMREKVRKYEFQLNSLKNTEKKLNSLVNENATLYKENVKNKTLLEQEKVLKGYRKKLNNNF
jgi:hypothetical protein